MKKIIAITALAAFVLAGCTNPKDDQQADARKNDERVTAQSLATQQKSQPTPAYDWSQYRQTLIEITDAKAATTQTTSFFFLEGVGLINACPSIGFPVPSTAQLTNPDAMDTSYQTPYTLPQAEPTGVYTGDSTGTYTICVNSDGKPYAAYWEGYVQTVTGPAEFRDGAVVLTGKPTGDFTKGN